MSELISKIKSIRWQHVLFVLLIALISVGSESCKSTGKLSKKERKAQIEAAKKQLQSIINGTTTLALEEQDKLISEIANKNYNDPELNELIISATQTMKRAWMEKEKAHGLKVDAARAALLDMLLNKEGKTADQLEKDLNAVKAQNLNDTEIFDLIARVEKKILEMRATGSGANLPVKTQIENAFQTIATSAKSGNLVQADNTIKNTLQYFTGEDAPVLIIISREGSTVDYDKPTTIRRYLEFLRDQKASNNAIDAIMTDANGKIKELDLIKK